MFDELKVANLIKNILFVILIIKYK